MAFNFGLGVGIVAIGRFKQGWPAIKWQILIECTDFGQGVSAGFPKAEAVELSADDILHFDIQHAFRH